MSMEEQIKEKLQTEFAPSVLELVNVSHLHEGHAGHDGGGQSHFNLYIVSEKFENVPRVARQRMIYATLGEEFKKGLHALSIRALALSEI